MKELLIIALLILLNGLFSMSETALISARKARLAQESKRGSKAARTALEIAENPDTFLSTIQIGITLIGILTGLYSGASFADSFASLLRGWGVPAAWSHRIAQVTIVVIVTYLSIVVGELVPKRIALSCADTVAKIVARPMHLLSKIALPLVWLLSVSTQALMRLLNLRGDENKTTESDVRQIIENGAASGEVQAVERDIMTRALVLGLANIKQPITLISEYAPLAHRQATTPLQHPPSIPPKKATQWLRSVPAPSVRGPANIKRALTLISEYAPLPHRQATAPLQPPPSIPPKKATQWLRSVPRLRCGGPLI